LTDAANVVNVILAIFDLLLNWEENFIAHWVVGAGRDWLTADIIAFTNGEELTTFFRAAGCRGVGDFLRRHSLGDVSEPELWHKRVAGRHGLLANHIRALLIVEETAVSQLEIRLPLGEAHLEMGPL